MSKAYFTRPIVGPISLIGCSVIFALLLLEVVLQTASLAFAERERGQPALSNDNNAVKILTVGDSHTYGIKVPAELAYPGVLESTLSSRLGDFPVEVINKGLPGTNSSQIRRSLPLLLAEHEPDFVVFCAGINNVWNHSAVEDRPHAFIAENSRVIRLFRLLKNKLESGDGSYSRPNLQRTFVNNGLGGVVHLDSDSGKPLITHEGNINERSSSIDEASSTLRKDLAVIRSTVNQYGASLVVLTYSSFPLPTRGPAFSLHEAMNNEFRTFSKAHEDVILVDVRPTFHGMLEDPTTRRDTLFLSENDDHPNAAGYALIGELVANAVFP